MSTLGFRHGRKPRNELRLPQQHFIAMDDWVKKLGNEAYIAWLTFFTWADRKDQAREADTIPTSMNKCIEKLGSNKKSYYQKIIRPLWNYALIDLEDVFAEVKGVRQRCVNIIVYEYPQNDAARATQPLEQIRNYDTEYNPEQRETAKKGGRKKAVDNVDEQGSFPEKLPKEQGGFLQKLPGGGFPQKPPGSFPQKHNNVLNIFNALNVLNISEEEKNIVMRICEKFAVEGREEDEFPVSPEQVIFIDNIVKYNVSFSLAYDLYEAINFNLRKYHPWAISNALSRLSDGMLENRIDTPALWFPVTLASEQEKEQHRLNNR